MIEDNPLVRRWFRPLQRTFIYPETPCGWRYLQIDARSLEEGAPMLSFMPLDEARAKLLIASGTAPWEWTDERGRILLRHLYRLLDGEDLPGQPIPRAYMRHMIVNYNGTDIPCGCPQELVDVDARHMEALR